MDVEILDTGTDYVRQELDPQLNVKEVGKKVGEKTVDFFKNLSSPNGINFGQVTVIEDFKPRTKTEESVEEVQAATEEVAEKPIEEKETIVEEAVTEEEAVTSEEQVSLEEKMAKKAVDELMAAKRKRGSKKIEESKNVKEKYGEMGKKLDYIDRNFDKLIDKLGITKSCWLE
jgi:hypothetical protein